MKKRKLEELQRREGNQVDICLYEVMMMREVTRLHARFFFFYLPLTITYLYSILFCLFIDVETRCTFESCGKLNLVVKYLAFMQYTRFDFLGKFSFTYMLINYVII